MTRVRCSENSTNPADPTSDPANTGPLTCTNTQQGPEGPVIRKVLSRVRATHACKKKFWTTGPSGPCHPTRQSR